MDLLKSQFDRIQQQLNGLSTSQKLLTAALVAIMVMTIAWWGRYASQPEFEPLVAQTLTDEDVTRISGVLEAHGIESQTSADRRILVPADRRLRALSLVSYAAVLPKNTADGFDELIKRLSPWDGQDKQNMVFNRGKEVLLAEVIGGYPDVASATVSIDPRFERVIGGNIEPTAFVSLRMKSGARASKQLVNAAASAVAGAQAGLAMKNIRVVVDGMPQRVKDDEDAAGGAGGGDADSVADLRQREEARLTLKVSQHFPEIQGVMVAVTVRVNNQTSNKHSQTVTKVEAKELTVSSSSKETTGAPPAPAVDPGATSNVGANGTGAITPAAGGDGSHTETEDKTTFAHFPTTVVEDSKTPAGEVTPVGASIRVPRSYYARIARGNAAAEPDEAAIAAKIKDELPKIRNTVLSCTGMKNADDVSVVAYFDPAPPIVAASVVSTPLALAVGGHSKEIVLGALALVSLFLVSTIVKKGAPVAALPLTGAAAAASAGPAAPTPPLLLQPADGFAGEVAEGNAMLDGLELDDDAVRTKQMMDQVSTMVQENPDAAANLVKRWLNRA